MAGAVGRTCAGAKDMTGLAGGAIEEEWPVWGYWVMVVKQKKA
jgi:hypothetical protein